MYYPNISERTSMEEIKRIHMEIWQYAMGNSEKPKTNYLADCVLCEYDYISRLVYYNELKEIKKQKSVAYAHLKMLLLAKEGKHTLTALGDYGTNGYRLLTQNATIKQEKSPSKFVT